jgi:cell division inhibitor SepF
MGFMSRAAEEMDQAELQESEGYNMVLVQPEHFEDAYQAGKYLKEGKAVLLNLEKADKEVAKRIIDFLTGFVFCCEGKLEKMSRTLMMVAPSDVTISGNLYGEFDTESDVSPLDHMDSE